MPRPRRRNPWSSTGEILLWLLFVALLFPAGFAGWAVGHYTSLGGGKSASASAAPSGHQGGANLPVSAIGDPAKGQKLFDSKHCSDCHSYNGHGGSDAPPLDFMRGHLSAREIAEMAGTIWNHLPNMIPHFKDEGIPLPTFSNGQMADLIAYLHGGPPGGATTTTTAAATTTSAATTTPAGTTTTKSGGGGGGNAAAGKSVFASSGCGSCHTFKPAGSTGSIGPNLGSAPAADAKADHGMALAAFVKESIVNPDAYVPKGYPKGVMPSTFGKSLSKSQLDDLVAFIVSGTSKS